MKSESIGGPLSRRLCLQSWWRLALRAGGVCGLAHFGLAQAWTQVGPDAAHFTLLPKIACDRNGELWLTMQDFDTSNHLGSVKRLQPAVGVEPEAWVYVGAPGSASESNDWWPNLAFSDDGEIFRASYDYRANASEFASPMLNLRRFDATTSAWEMLQPFPMSYSEAHFPDLQLDRSGFPVVAFRDGNDGMQQWPYGALSVLRYEKLPGGGWSARFLGGQGFSRSFFPGGTHTHSATWFTCLEVAPDGRLWVAWREDALLLGGVPMVATYVPEIDAWERVGDVGLGLLPGRSANMALAIDKLGVPYLAVYFWDYFVVYRWEGNLKHGTWLPLGDLVGLSDAPLMTPGTEYREWVAFEISPTGIPYLAYRSLVHANRAVVRRYVDGSWKLVGDPAFTGTTGEDDQLSLTFQGSAPVVAMRHSEPATYHATMQTVKVWTFR